MLTGQELLKGLDPKLQGQPQVVKAESQTKKFWRRKQRNQMCPPPPIMVLCPAILFNLREYLATVIVFVEQWSRSIGDSWKEV